MVLAFGGIIIPPPPGGGGLSYTPLFFGCMINEERGEKTARKTHNILK
jgi:hypothetical protein